MKIVYYLKRLFLYCLKKTIYSFLMNPDWIALATSFAISLIVELLKSFLCQIIADGPFDW